MKKLLLAVIGLFVFGLLGFGAYGYFRSKHAAPLPPAEPPVSTSATDVAAAGPADPALPLADGAAPAESAPTDASYPGELAKPAETQEAAKPLDAVVDATKTHTGEDPAAKPHEDPLEPTAAENASDPASGSSRPSDTSALSQAVNDLADRVSRLEAQLSKLESGRSRSAVSSSSVSRTTSPAGDRSSSAAPSIASAKFSLYPNAIAVDQHTTIFSIRVEGAGVPNATLSTIGSLTTLAVSDAVIQKNLPRPAGSIVALALNKPRGRREIQIGHGAGLQPRLEQAPGLLRVVIESGGGSSGPLSATSPAGSKPIGAPANLQSSSGVPPRAPMMPNWQVRALNATNVVLYWPERGIFLNANVGSPVEGYGLLKSIDAANKKVVFEGGTIMAE